ncbi:MAG: hypothetical protein H7240_11295 [Glaciimonas sp.]|nr:hypothetical protein [Glaciimonas sp.]
MNIVTTVDDLWHAAVNGHGTYFNAKDPQKFKNSLMNVLQSIQHTASAGSSIALFLASLKNPLTKIGHTHRALNQVNGLGM